MGVMGFLLLFCAVIFFAPAFGGLFLESPNFEPANPLQTPPHIAPVWYFTPFYAMLARGALVRRHAGLGRAGDGRRGRGAVLPALARPLAGQLDPLPRAGLQVHAGDFRRRPSSRSASAA